MTTPVSVKVKASLGLMSYELPYLQEAQLSQRGRARFALKILQSHSRLHHRIQHV